MKYTFILWLFVSVLLFATSSCSETTVLNSVPPLQNNAKQGKRFTAITLGQPKIHVETTAAVCGQYKLTTTQSSYVFPGETLIDITKIEKDSCAITSKTGTVAISAYHRAPNGRIGAVRWKHIIPGPYADVGDPRWDTSVKDLSRFIVAYTDAEANFHRVYQYISLETGERVVISEPPALFVSLNDGKEIRLIGIRGNFNMLRLSEDDEPTITLRVNRPNCEDLLAIVEYGSDKHQLDRAYLMRTQRKLEWIVDGNSDSSHWIFQKTSADPKTLSSLIKDSIANVRGLVAEFQMVNMNEGVDSPLQIPVVGDRLGIEHAVLPQGFRLSRQCESHSG